MQDKKITIFYWNLFQALSEELLSNGGQEELLFGLENMDLTGECFLFLKKIIHGLLKSFIGEYELKLIECINERWGGSNPCLYNYTTFVLHKSCRMF